MSITATSVLGGENWVMTPAALAVGERPPATIYDQTWLMVLSGVVSTSLEGFYKDQWVGYTVEIFPDLGHLGTPPAGPLGWTIQQYSIPIPSPDPPNNLITPAFSVLQWAPFVSLGNIVQNNAYEDPPAVAAYGVNVWRPHHFSTAIDAVTHQPAGNIFNGIDVDVDVLGESAFVTGFGFNITLLGKIVFGESYL